MNLKLSDNNLIISTSLKEKIPLGIISIIGIWFMVMLFYGSFFAIAWTNYYIITSASWAWNLFNIITYSLFYVNFGAFSILLTIGGISSLLKSKKVVMNSSEFEFNIKKYLIFSQDNKIRTSEVDKIIAVQDDTSDFCQLLAIDNKGNRLEIENKYSLDGMNALNELGDKINKLTRVKFEKGEFIPFIDENEIEEEYEKESKG